MKMQFISLVDANQQQPPAVFHRPESSFHWKRPFLHHRCWFWTWVRWVGVCVCNDVMNSWPVEATVVAESFSVRKKDKQLPMSSLKPFYSVWNFVSVHICVLGLFYRSKLNIAETVDWINQPFGKRQPTHTHPGCCWSVCVRDLRG